MILVTGANGRLGSALIAAFHAQGTAVRGCARSQPLDLPAHVEGFAIGPFDPSMTWAAAVADVSCIVHCASVTNVGPGPRDEDFAAANVEAVQSLAVAAAQAGVKRIVYISSATVNGRHSGLHAFTPDDVPNPQSPYSRSKLAAEQILRRAERETGIEVVIVRPPRIIWPQLTGNLVNLGKLIEHGLPLPFGMLTTNGRDNVSSANLLSVLVACATDPRAAGQTFLLADGRPLSTRALVEWLGTEVGCQPVLLPVPKPLVRLAILALPQKLLGGMDRKEMLGELFENLLIDISALERVIGWRPLA